MIGWEQIRHFNPSEFDSPDQPGSGKKIDWRLVVKLDLMREALGKPIIITSGFRTPAANRRAGGAENSSHLRGLAADIRCTSGRFRWELLREAYNVGFKRIGMDEKHVHLDIDRGLPGPVLFLE